METPYVSHWEDSALVIMARVLGESGTPVTQGTIQSISVRVWDVSTGAEVGAALTPSVADVVYDTLQTGEPWDGDSEGYNVKYTVPGTRFPEGSTRYQVEMILTPASGSPIAVVARNTTKPLYSS